MKIWYRVLLLLMGTLQLLEGKYETKKLRKGHILLMHTIWGHRERKLRNSSEKCFPTLLTTGEMFK